jgi:ribonucleoside-diphosphate reductase beta chain
MNEIDYTKDRKGVEKLDPVAKRMFHLNILYQNNMDSLVPNTFGLLSEIASDTWLSYLYSRIATEEQIHSLSYSNGLFQVFGEKVTEMLDHIYRDPILQRRTEKEIESANRFIQLIFKEEREDDTGKLALVELLLRTYYLEGVKFPFSFFVTWTINKAYGNAIQGFSQALKLIAWDEMTIHTTTGQNLLKILMNDPSQGFTHLRREIEEMAYRMADETAQLEFEWNKYLQKEGPIPGYTLKIGEHFIKYWTDYRLKGIGLAPIFNEPKSDVIDWFNNYRNLNKTQVALQEADNTNYQKGTLKNDLDRFGEFHFTPPFSTFPRVEWGA